MSAVSGEAPGQAGRHDHSGDQAADTPDIAQSPLGANVGGFPMINVLVIELGVAAALIVFAAAASLRFLAIALLILALALGGIRRHGRWVPQWIAIGARFVLRKRHRTFSPDHAESAATELSLRTASSPLGPEDQRVALLRLLIDDLLVLSSSNHDQHSIGVAWHQGTWTATILIDPVPAMVSPVGSHAGVPLAALAHCLRDRGVVLDSIGVIWHCYPGSTRLPADSPAVTAYNEVLGPLPAVAQRTTWVTVRLDPSRCPAAVHERGGGVAGAHRALLGAVSRVQGALDAAGLGSRALSADELLRAGVNSAELTAEAGRGEPVELTENWSGVRSGGISHSSHAITGWPAATGQLDSLTSIRALSTSVALAVSPGSGDEQVGIRGVVRVSARTAEELAAADQRIATLTAGSAIALSTLNGQQAAAVASTMPVGGVA